MSRPKAGDGFSIRKNKFRPAPLGPLPPLDLKDVPLEAVPATKRSSPRAQRGPLTSNPPSPVAADLRGEWLVGPVEEKDWSQASDEGGSPEGSLDGLLPSSQATIRAAKKVKADARRLQRPDQTRCSSRPLTHKSRAPSSFTNRRRPSADALLKVYFPTRPSASTTPRPALITIAASASSVVATAGPFLRAQDVDDEILFKMIQKDYHGRRGLLRQAISLRGLQRINVSNDTGGAWKEGTLEELMASPAKGRGKQDIVRWVRKVDSYLPPTQSPPGAAHSVGKLQSGAPAFELVEGWRVGRIVFMWTTILLLSFTAGVLWMRSPMEQRGDAANRVQRGLVVMQAGIFVGGTVAAGCAVVSWLVG